MNLLVKPTVFVVDPDIATHELVRGLADTMNFRCETFASGRAFLDADVASHHGCAVLELRVPDINGLRLQESLRQRGVPLPVVFLSAQPTVSMAVRAMRAGAVHFLEKPVRDHELWDAVQEAIGRDAARCAEWRQREEQRRRLALLTSKEREVLELIGRGWSKRAIADELDVCVRTVELRSRQLMKKLAVKSLVELVHFAVSTCHGDDGTGCGEAIQGGVHARREDEVSYA